MRPNGQYVLYWMIANRRPHWNYSLDHAINYARELGKPLLVFEALRCGYRWASDRLHRFVLQGMAANQQTFAAAGIQYFPYVEPEHGAGKGLLEALAAHACVVVTDDFPCFFLPRMVQAAAARLPVRVDSVDSNGLLPLRASAQAYPTAYAFRRFLQKVLPDHLPERPVARPLAKPEGLQGATLPARLLQRWERASAALLKAEPDALAALPIDHTVGPASFDGGHVQADSVSRNFIQHRLPHYGTDRSHPDVDAQSHLSPYLHFGHISAHAVFHSLARHESWDMTHVHPAKGSKEGFWGMRPNAESFLDEIITWREVGYNMCVHRPEDYDQFDSLPSWAQATLAEHAGDPRPHTYNLKQLDAAQTYDKIWNAAQNQLVREGRLHNYMRMLWGKKILEWSRTPQEALKVMEELNNKYAVDGRDPNSYSGIFWTLGRYDRPWPEREVFGKIRCMTSDSTARKLQLKQYLATYA